MKTFAVDSENILTIALQFNLTYSTSQKDKYYSLEECIDIGNKISNALSEPKPNFIFHWLIHTDMIKFYYSDDKIEQYPYLHMFAHVKHFH